MIRVENLTKQFGRVTAIDNLSFEVERGEIVGFLGPNGAGKTTTMRILSCFMQPTGGSVTIAGLDVFSESREVRRKIGYLPENVPTYPEMRVSEYLSYRAGIKGLKGRRLRSRVDYVTDACGLTDVTRSIIGQLSKGYRQRIGLADSLVHEPELLILDEPTTGLDPNQIRHIRQLIKSLAERHTVLLSSHILPEVESVCQRVLIIKNGRIVASNTTEELVDSMADAPCIVVEAQGPRDGIATKLKGIPGVMRVSSEPCREWFRFTCQCKEGADIRPALLQIMSEHGWELLEMKTERRNLEDVFISLTSDEQESSRKDDEEADENNTSQSSPGGRS
jgi:ABC-2 type transport system ATP-binding protein